MSPFTASISVDNSITFMSMLGILSIPISELHTQRHNAQELTQEHDKREFAPL